VPRIERVSSGECADDDDSDNGRIDPECCDVLRQMLLRLRNWHRIDAELGGQPTNWIYLYEFNYLDLPNWRQQRVQLQVLYWDRIGE
jgi:hypothetical protein